MHRFTEAQGTATGESRCSQGNKQTRGPTHLQYRCPLRVRAYFKNSQEMAASKVNPTSTELQDESTK